MRCAPVALTRKRSKRVRLRVVVPPKATKLALRGQQDGLVGKCLLPSLPA